jgi:hypothetical protein
MAEETSTPQLPSASAGRNTRSNGCANYLTQEVR